MIPEPYFKQLLKRMEHFHPLDAAFVLELNEPLKLIDVQPGQILLEAGKVPEFVWFSPAPHCRQYTIDRETKDEHTTWFNFVDDFIYAHPGFFSQEPSTTLVEVLEDGKMVVISHKDFKELYHKFAMVDPLVEKIRGDYDRLRMEHQQDLKQLNATERVRKLFNARSHLFNVAKQKDIANFLGIKDDGLNRYL